MKEGGQVEDNRKGFSGREAPYFQPLHSEFKHCVLPNRTHLEVGFGLLALESAISGLYFRFKLLHTAWKAFVTLPLTRAKTHFLLLDALVLLSWCRYLALSPFWAFAYVIPLPGSSVHPSFLPSSSASSC